MAESNEEFDVIAVGAGIGGATCAALLSKRGVRTLLVDKAATPGGKAGLAQIVGQCGEQKPDATSPIGGPY